MTFEEEADINQSHNCPYCESAKTCTHKFAVYDATWGCIEDGHLINSEEIEAILSQYFFTKMDEQQQNPELINGYDDFFQELWQDVFMSNETTNVKVESDLMLPDYSRFLFEMLTSIEESSDGGLEAGPGQSNVLYEFYCENKEIMNECLKQQIIQYLE